jgi:6-phosphogluconolactonase
MAWTEELHRDSAALCEAVANRLNEALDAAQHERGEAVLTLAGGRTSPPIMRQLANRDRNWRGVCLLPTDERWVAATHPDCNLTQLQHSFAGLDGLRWIALVPALPVGEVSAEYANAQLATVSAPFDATLLGMGEDVHFASLFPGAPTLADALGEQASQPAFALQPDPLPQAGPHPRVSLSLSRLRHTRQLLLVITGNAKRAVLERAQATPDPARLPISALLHSPHSTVEIHWSP